RDPMFLRDGSAVWLLWERKASQTGSTSLVTGELLGRRIDNGRMGPTVVLASGAVDYRVAHDAEVRDGRFALVGSSLPRNAQRVYTLTQVAIENPLPASTAPFAGWKRVELPMPETEPRRHAVREHGREYQLFWMDSHVHSGLSADA